MRALWRGRLAVGRHRRAQGLHTSAYVRTAAAAAASRLAGTQTDKDGDKAYPYYVAYTEEGTVRVDVRKSPELVGVASSRGTRGTNQDRAEFRPLRIPGMVADRRDKSSAQVMYMGVYDG
ncbi:hypothetical protein GGI05_006646, partial [Coemansia sp. RSA 2603]